MNARENGPKGVPKCVALKPSAMLVWRNSAQGGFSILLFPPCYLRAGCPFSVPGPRIVLQSRKDGI